MADRVVAALSAEPETIEELEAAVTRFVKPTNGHGLFDSFREGISEQPWDAGIVIVDLAARIIASESAYSSLQSKGKVQYHDGSTATDIWIYYQVSDDWLFVGRVEEWHTLAPRRRDERASTPRLDAREVLYGKVAEFIVRACMSAAATGMADPIGDIHARWLMTPREDLRNRSPREVMLAKREFIDMDLQWRANQWSLTGQCPPGLSRKSAAYRFGGFGTHEIVLYYDFVRVLLNACWGRVSQETNLEVEAEIERLAHLKADWLSTPQPELEGMTPSYVIQCERARLPIALSPEGMDFDDDCPLCQMMREESGPTFWHLDGSHMDDDFPFSFHRTREEWEEEQREWERDWEEFRREQEQKRVNASGEEDSVEVPSVWQRSGTSVDAPERLPGEVAIKMTLFVIGAHIGELGVDLTAELEGKEFAEALRQDFASLRHALRTEVRERVEVWIQRLRTDLAIVAERIPHLMDRCTDLQKELDRLGDLIEEH